MIQWIRAPIFILRGRNQEGRTVAPFTWMLFSAKMLDFHFFLRPSLKKTSHYNFFRTIFEGSTTSPTPSWSVGTVG